MHIINHKLRLSHVISAYNVPAIWLDAGAGGRGGLAAVELVNQSPSPQRAQEDPTSVRCN